MPTTRCSRCIVFAYFGWSWTRSGQTLGMRAWRIRLEHAGGRRLDWAESLVRCLLGACLAWLAALGAWYLSQPGSLAGHGLALVLVGPLVANFAWVVIDRDGRSLLDLAGRARVWRVV